MSDKNTSIKDLHLEERVFTAKMDLMPQMKQVVPILIQLHSISKKIADKHNISSDYLKDWMLQQLPYAEVSEDTVDTTND